MWCNDSLSAVTAYSLISGHFAQWGQALTVCKTGHLNVLRLSCRCFTGASTGTPSLRSAPHLLRAQWGAVSAPSSVPHHAFRCLRLMQGSPYIQWVLMVKSTNTDPHCSVGKALRGFCMMIKWILLASTFRYSFQVFHTFPLQSLVSLAFVLTFSLGSSFQPQLIFSVLMPGFPELWLHTTKA